jgi:hypothetical protein
MTKTDDIDAGDPASGGAEQAPAPTDDGVEGAAAGNGGVGGTEPTVVQAAPVVLREPLDPKRSGIAGALLVLAFFLFVFVSSSDRILAGYHRPNEIGYGAVQITGGPVAGGWLDAEDFKNRVDTWRGFECANREAAPPAPPGQELPKSEPCPEVAESPYVRWRDPNRPLQWFFVGDLVFALVYTAGLVVLWTAFRARRDKEVEAHERLVAHAESCPGSPVPPLEGALRSSRWVLGAILALGACDVLEDVVLGLQASATLNGSAPNTVVVFAGMVLGWAKWFLVLVIALVFLLSAFGGFWRGRREAFARIWAAALVAAVVALLVRVPQTEDGLRSENGLQLAGSLALAVVVGVAAALAGSRALEHRRSAYAPGAPPPPGVYGFRYGSSRLSGWPLGAVGVILIALAWFPSVRGLWVPGALLVVLWVLSIVIHPKYTLPDGVVPPTDEAERADNRSPVFWAAVLVWALALAASLALPGWARVAIAVTGLLGLGLWLRFAGTPRRPWSGDDTRPSSDKATRRRAPANARARVLNDWSRTAGALGAAVPMLVAAGAITAFTVDPLPRSLDPDAARRVTLLLLGLGFFGVAATIATFWFSRQLIGALSRHAVDDNPTLISRRVWARATTVVIVGAAVIVLLLARSDDARAIAQTVGSMTVVLAFAFVVAATAVLCRTGSDVLVRYPWAVPATLRSLRVRRPPLLFGLVVWLLLGSVVNQGHAHDVRELSSPPPDRTVQPASTDRDGSPDEGVPVSEYTQHWRVDAEEQLRKAQEVAEESSSGGSATDPEIPVVLVATSGGGIRASYWTSAVLDCLFERAASAPSAAGGSIAPDPCANDVSATDGSPSTHRRPFLYALSGVSGGSLGIVEWLSYLERNPSGVGERVWFDETQRRDFLAPTLSTMLLVDGPNLFLRNQDAGIGDRAGALEEAWEQGWVDYDASSPLDAGFATTQQSLDEPMAILNSSSVADGCRFNVTVLDLATPQKGAGLNSGCRGLDEGSAIPGSIDLTTWKFCNGGHDIRRSTAALLSARFPYVTPSGWLDGCRDDARTFLVDGGYIETSGASALVALWNNGLKQQLCPDTTAHCRFVPVFVQIDNDPGDSIGPLAPAKEPPPSPNELLVPPSALQSASGGWANASRASACLEFNQGDSEGYWIRLSVGQQPGAPPPLGWVLSDQTREALRQELSSTDNAARIRWLHEWLDHPEASAPAGFSKGSC